MGHDATLAVNAALVSSQLQHRTSTVPLHPSINAEHEAGQPASAIFYSLRYDPTGNRIQSTNQLGHSTKNICQELPT